MIFLRELQWNSGSWLCKNCFCCSLSKVKPQKSVFFLYYYQLGPENQESKLYWRPSWMQSKFCSKSFLLYYLVLFTVKNKSLRFIQWKFCSFYWKYTAFFHNFQGKYNFSGRHFEFWSQYFKNFFMISWRLFSACLG